MINKVSNKVKHIMTQAAYEARAYQDSELKPEHIMLSILVDDDNRVVDVLHRLGVNTNDFYETISVLLVNNNININKMYSDNEDIILRPSKKTNYIVNQMDSECSMSGEDEITEAHLMLAILKSGCNSQKLLLNHYGINYSKFKNENMADMGETPDEFDDGPIRPRKSKRLSKDSSKTPALDNYCRNITEAAMNGKLDPVIGRQKEIKRVTQILSRRKKNNPVLIGEPGVGKTAIVEGLANLIYEGKAPKPLMDKKIFSLDLASAVAGTKYRGQFEERMKQILEELKDNDDIILFIDELHTLVGAGNASGALDASNIFKPALARGEIQVLGATTLDEFRENIEKDGALTRRFQQVLIEEPSIDEAINILDNIKGNYEKYHKVSYSSEIIKNIVKLSDRYISDRALPDKAIDIMDEVGAATNIDVKLPKEILEIKEKISNILNKKQDMVKKQQYEDAAICLKEEKELNDALDAKTKEWEKDEVKSTTVITEEMVTDVVSTMTGIPLNKLSDSDISNLKNLDEDLKGTVIGQEEAIAKVARAIKRSRLGIKDANKPIGSYIFLGSTGVGKTFLAKTLAEHVFGDEDNLIRVDMSEFMEKYSMTKLIGTAPGYVGYEEGGHLTELVRRKPYSVVLFDEIEKAHEDIFNLLLQILDEGHVTDGLGRKIDFKNTLIIMTSNIGVKEASQFGGSIGFGGNSIVDEEEKSKKIIQKALKDKFKPEFINRIDETIIFRNLSEEDITVIIKNELKKVKARISELGYKLSLTSSAMSFIAKEGYHREYGARPLKRAIQKYVEDPIADAVMDGDLKEGGTIKLGYNAKEGITAKIS